LKTENKSNRNKKNHPHNPNPRKKVTSKHKQNQVQTYHILETNLTFAANYKE
jgi:hypothetical protein